ncbi:MAG: hypothetical protein PHW91_12580 [Bacteroidales bacterium]|nr:hypothetical protein [Bacteroidales bacterium]
MLPTRFCSIHIRIGSRAAYITAHESELILSGSQVRRNIKEIPAEHGRYFFCSIHIRMGSRAAYITAHESELILSGSPHYTTIATKAYRIW